MAVQVRHIDGERRLLRVQQGKGAKERMVMVSETLLQRLRAYWRLYRPRQWLFPGRRPDVSIGVTSLQKVFQRAKHRAGVEKVGGIHSLRHAYATHQLESGTPVHELQRLLGHHNIQSTLRYVHWVPSYREREGGRVDLLGVLEQTR